jgi:hypothetical protein
MRSAAIWRRLGNPIRPAGVCNWIDQGELARWRGAVGDVRLEDRLTILLRVFDPGIESGVAPPLGGAPLPVRAASSPQAVLCSARAPKLLVSARFRARSRVETAINTRCGFVHPT